jgi:hypothetical protein
LAAGFGVAPAVTTGGGGLIVSVNEALPEVPFESVTTHDTGSVRRPGPGFVRLLIENVDPDPNWPWVVIHWYELYVPLPPVAEHVNWMEAPELAGFGVAEAVTTTGGGTFVTLSVKPVTPAGSGQ